MCDHQPYDMRTSMTDLALVVDKQSDRHRQTCRDRRTNIQTYTQTDRTQTNRLTQTWAQSYTEAQGHRDTETQKHRDAETQGHIDEETQPDIQTNRQTDTQTHRHVHANPQIDKLKHMFVLMRVGMHPPRKTSTRWTQACRFSCLGSAFRGNRNFEFTL